MVQIRKKYVVKFDGRPYEILKGHCLGLLRFKRKRSLVANKDGFDIVSTLLDRLNYKTISLLCISLPLMHLILIYMYAQLCIRLVNRIFSLKVHFGRQFCLP